MQVLSLVTAVIKSHVYSNNVTEVAAGVDWRLRLFNDGQSLVIVQGCPNTAKQCTTASEL